MKHDHLALRAEADAAFAGNSYDRAAELYEKLCAEPAVEGWSLFSLGRIARENADVEKAIGFFARAQNLLPKFFWVHYAQLDLLLQTKAAAEVLSHTANLLIEADLPEDLQQSHKHKIEKLAHGIFDAASRRQGALILEWLIALPDENALSQIAKVRIVEEGQDEASRRQLADELKQDPDLDDVGKRVLSNYFGTDIVSDTLQPSVPEPPRDPEPELDSFGDYLTAMKAAVPLEDMAKLDRLRAGIKRFPPRQRLFFNLVAEIELGHALAAAGLFFTHVRLYSDAPKFPGIRIVYILLDAHEHDRARVTLSLLKAYHPEDENVRLLDVTWLMRMGRYSEAERRFDHFFEALPDKSAAMLRTKAELLAMRGELDAAYDILRLFLEDEDPPRGLIYTVVRVMAEQKKWDQVYEIGIGQLHRNISFQGVLEPLVRAARETGKLRPLYDSLGEVDLEALPPQKFIRQAVFEDLISAGEIELLDEIDSIDLPSDRRARLLAKLNGTQRIPASKDSLHIYYCADRAYLEPALISLVSLALSNLSLARVARFSLIVEADIVPLAEEGVLPLQRELGLTVDIVNAADIIPPEAQLRTDYGMVTGGHSLSVAAYYRIFFARKLAEEGANDQALYIDADTLVRANLPDILAEETGAPLCARGEVERPEIDRAATSHNLTGSYFNSGVLWFDLRHPDIIACLDRSIQAALDPEVHLFFQDQCALNIGFDGHTNALDSRFNHYVTPDRKFSGETDDAVILHFLDRPKPWDSLYRRNAGEWFKWFGIRQGLSVPVADEDNQGVKK